MKEQLEYLEGKLKVLKNIFYSVEGSRSLKKMCSQEIHHLETIINFIKEKENISYCECKYSHKVIMTLSKCAACQKLVNE